jgi:hypothetical protein
MFAVSFLSHLLDGVYAAIRKDLLSTWEQWMKEMGNVDISPETLVQQIEEAVIKELNDQIKILKNTLDE